MKLNDDQKRAVATNERRVLVLAGPGSGKTRVITERVNYLVRERGVSGRDILLLTFTRRAAAEMQSRISEAVGERETRKMWIGTFHAVCLRILREYGEKLGYKPETLTVYDQSDQRAVIDDIIAARGEKVKITALYEIMQAFGTQGWNAIETYRGEHPRECSVFDEYRMRLRENNAVDYGLILAEVQRLFSEHPYVLAYYHAKFPHVLIVEYQDTDRLQYELHSAIDPEYLFLVGDSDQAIYSFRGATLDVLLNFDADNFGATTLELPVCYRCSRAVVNAANLLIANNQRRIAKSIIAARDTVGRVSVARHQDVETEAQRIVEEVRSVLDDGHAPSDIAILARTRKWLQAISDALTADGVPTECIDRENDFYLKPDVKLFHAWLTLAVNDRDNLAFLRVRRSLGIDDLLYAQIRLHATRNEQSHEQAAVSMLGRPLFDPKVREQNGKSLLLWSSTLLMTDDLAPATVTELRQRISNWIETGSDDVHEYLLWLQQRDVQDALIEPTESVKLMTCHAAKGLEFRTVIVAGAHGGHFPHSMSGKTDDGIEEERRLMYVAATRAKDVLCLTYPASIQHCEKLALTEPSRFLREMGLVVP